MRILFFLLTFFTGVSLFAQPQAFYMSTRFCEPKGEPYLDMIFDIDGNSLTNILDKKDTLVQYKIGIEIELRNASDSIINASKSELLSPVFSKKESHMFLDLVRLSTKSGLVNVSIKLTDLGSKDEKKITKFSEEFVVNPPRKFGIHLSDLLLLSAVIPGDANSPFTRNNQQLIPYLNDYFPTETDKILFYSEIYNSTLQFPGGKFAYAYQIVHPNTGKVVFNKQKIRRATTNAVVPVIAALDLTNVPNGKYKLRFEVRNTLNEVVIFKEKEFYRENRTYQQSPEEIEDLALANSFIGKMQNDTILNEYLMCLRPIATQSERIIIDNPAEMLPTTDQKQRYFLNFWMQRNQTQPSLAWYQYKKDVDLTEELFSNSIKRGYESDRGRIFLAYGKPDSRIERPSEPVSYPYEIWQYDNIENQTNVRFVFYNPNIATNDYQLLHSEMRGEFRNPNWQNELQRRTDPSNNVNSRAPATNFGSNAKEFFDNPR